MSVALEPLIHQVLSAIGNPKATIRIKQPPFCAYGKIDVYHVFIHTDYDAEIFNIIYDIMRTNGLSANPGNPINVVGRDGRCLITFHFLYKGVHAFKD